MTITLYENFHNGTITDNPLGAAVTQINSSEFSELPVITSGEQQVYLTLDPLGVGGGDPEIVLVTEHADSSTSIVVVRGQQTALHASPARQHSQGTAWRWSYTARDILSHSGYPGDIKASMQSGDHGPWLQVDQAVANADTKHPALWAIAPASWKSGTTLNIPSMDGRVLMGGGTLGATGGSSSVSIGVTHLPPHDHSINHNHPAFTSGGGGSHNHNIASHTHTMANHTHNLGNHTHTMGHTHGIGGSNAFWSSVGANNGNFQVTFAGAGSGNTASDGATAGPSSGSTGGPSNNTSAGPSTNTTGGSGTLTTGTEPNHTHGVDIPNYTGTSGSAGSGTALPLPLAPHLRVNFFIHV